MALGPDQITAKNFKEFYDRILPYLNGAGGNDYSIEEKIVGSWIDGKPVYQKSYSVSVDVPNDRWTTIVSNVSGLNIEKLLRGCYTSPQNKSAAGNELWQIDNSNNLQIYISGYGIYIDTLTIQYTKTTD